MPWSGEHPQVSVVVPVFRKAGTVRALLQEFELFISFSSIDCELIIVDDGSSKNISDELFLFAAEREAVRYIKHETNLGKGRAIADGVAIAAAPIIVFTDVDMSYSPSFIEHVYARFNSDPRVHFIVGSRRHPESDIKLNYNIPHRITSWCYNMLARVVVGMIFSDVQCGIKAFRRDAARLLFSDLTVARFAFDSEIFLRAKKYGLRFYEMPVVYQRIKSTPHWIISSGVKMIIDLWYLYATSRAHRSKT